MKNKTANITNFIGIYDNYIPKQECKKAIELFKEQDKFNKTLDRITFENAPIGLKKDKTFFALSNNLDLWFNDLKSILVNFDIAFNHYLKHTGSCEAYGQDKFYYTQQKIQKTLPTEGFHNWHIEHAEGFEHESRAFVFSVYLNNVKEGGETEFLHFSKRVKPKTGRIVIWPAGMPYIHRGNPPLSGEKYILTSWMRLRP